MTISASKRFRFFLPAAEFLLLLTAKSRFVIAERLPLKAYTTGEGCA